MSHLNVYIKREGVLKKATVQSFVAKGLLLRKMNEEELQTLFRRAVREDVVEPYDLGLFYIDTDNKSIVSAQSNFTLQELEKAVGKKLTKGWKYAEMEPEEITPEIILSRTA